MSKSDPEVFLPSINHWRFDPGTYKERVTRAQLKYVLLECPDPIYEGQLHKWESKHVGAGVYDLWISKDPQI